MATAYQRQPVGDVRRLQRAVLPLQREQHPYLFDLTWECWRDGGCRGADRGRPDRDRRPGHLRGAGHGRDGAPRSATRAPPSRSCSAASTTPTTWSTGCEFAPDDDQLVAAFHSYDFKECGDQGVLGRRARRRSPTACPVLTSELGAEDPRRRLRRRLPGLGRRARTSARCSGSGPTTPPTRWRWWPTIGAGRRRTGSSRRTG